MKESKMKKNGLFYAFCATVATLFAFTQPSSAIVLVEIDYSGTANTAVPGFATGIPTTDPQFTVFNAAISPTGVKAFAVGGTSSTAAWLYGSSGTAASNTDLFASLVPNYGSATRLDNNIGLAAAGETFTIQSVQIDVRSAASTGIMWQFGYQKATGAVNTIVGNVAIAMQTTSDPITTYTIDLTGEGLTATSSAATWTVSQGLRGLFYQSNGTDNDGFEVDAMRLVGTSSIPEPGTVGLLGLGALVLMARRRRSVK